MRTAVCSATTWRLSGPSWNAGRTSCKHPPSEDGGKHGRGGGMGLNGFLGERELWNRMGSLRKST